MRNSSSIALDRSRAPPRRFPSIRIDRSVRYGDYSKANGSFEDYPEGGGVGGRRNCPAYDDFRESAAQIFAAARISARASADPPVYLTDPGRATKRRPSTWLIHLLPGKKNSRPGSPRSTRCLVPGREGREEVQVGDKCANTSSWE